MASRAPILARAAEVRSLPDLALLLRELRRWDARRRGAAELTYRELAAKTGWSQAAIWDYFAGRTLPPTDRFDDLVRLLGAIPAEQGALATARDRVEESRRSNPSTTPAQLLVPRQLPPAVSHFVGREDEMAFLSRLADQVDGGCATVLISTIGGMGGIGKTALAVYWGHRVRDRFPDGQLYVNLRGFGPSEQTVHPSEALRGFLDAFGVASQRIPVNVEAQTALYRSRVADRRVLVVLDNARDAEQVRPLLPGTAGCLAVVTSRDQLASLVVADGARTLTLGLLPSADARQMLTSRLDANRTNAELDAVNELTTHCAGLPLALSIVAARAGTQPRFPLRALANQLHDTRRRLDTFANSDPTTDVRAVFSWSYRALETVDPVAARLFRLLGLHPGPDITVEAAASLAGEPVGRTRRALVVLAGAHLLIEHVPGRYTLHDLVRAYAGELAHAVDPDAERHAAIRRALDHYLQTGYEATGLLEPYRTPLPLEPPQPDVSLTDLADYDAAMAWFTAEHRVLLAAIGHAKVLGLDSYVWKLAWTITDFLYRRASWHDCVAAQRAALDAATRLADLSAQARAHNNLGGMYVRLGRYDDARQEFLEAVRLNREHNDLVGQATNHANLSSLSNVQGHHQEALRHAQSSLELYRAGNHRDGYAYALNEVGRCHSLLGDHQQALSCSQQALDINRELGDRRGQAECWEYLGRAHHELGNPAQAIGCYQYALDINRELGRRCEEADTVAALGDAYHVTGQPDAAHAAWTHALKLFDEIGHCDADKVRNKLRDL